MILQRYKKRLAYAGVREPFNNCLNTYRFTITQKGLLCTYRFTIMVTLRRLPLCLCQYVHRAEAVSAVGNIHPKLRQRKFAPSFLFPGWLHVSDGFHHILMVITGSENLIVSKCVTYQDR